MVRLHRCMYSNWCVGILIYCEVAVAFVCHRCRVLWHELLIQHGHIDASWPHHAPYQRVCDEVVQPAGSEWHVYVRVSVEVNITDKLGGGGKQVVMLP